MTKSNLVNGNKYWLCHGNQFAIFPDYRVAPPWCKNSLANKLQLISCQLATHWLAL